MRHHIVGWFVGFSALWIADGVSSAVARGSHASASDSLRLSLGPFLYFGWLSVLLALCVGWGHGRAADAYARALSGWGVGQGPRAPRALLAASWATLALLLYEGAIYTAVSFHNRELASLLLVVVVAGSAAGVLALVPQLALGLSLRLRRWRRLDTVLWSLLQLVPLSVLGYLAFDNRSGFEQLAQGIRAGCLGLLVAVPLAIRLAREPLARVRAGALWGAGLLVVLASAGTAAVWDGYPRVVERETGFAGRALVQLRDLSDFDDDGFSAWFAGGDCRPFDPAVHPLAPEIIADGVDNNCLGGDRQKPIPSEPPRWTGPVSEKSDELNLLILTIDTVRTDHLPMFGYKRNTTPYLAELAAESLLFERTYTSAPLTRLALSSMFASQQASRVRWDDMQRKTPPPRIEHDQPWFPRILQREGFRTAAFVPAFSQFERSGHGFHYGFSRYDARSPMTYRGGSMRGFPAEKQVDKAIDWLERHDSGRFFLWVHFVEPHFQYERHRTAPDWGSEPQDLYDAELWYADHQAGRLLEHLREAGRFEDTVVLVAGDHGESFSEHGQRYHGFELYEPGIRTVGMLHAPGLEAGRVQAPVSLMDFIPTLLNLLGVEARYEELRGQNLLPVARGEADPRPRVLVELFRLPLVGYELAVIEERYKLYYVTSSGQFMLFDLQEDPDERHPLPEDHPAFGRLADYLTAMFERTLQERSKKPEVDPGGTSQKPKKPAGVEAASAEHGTGSVSP